jgi:hypothetical protein
MIINCHIFEDSDLNLFKYHRLNASSAQAQRTFLYSGRYPSDCAHLEVIIDHRLTQSYHRFKRAPPYGKMHSFIELLPIKTQKMQLRIRAIEKEVRLIITKPNL